MTTMATVCGILIVLLGFWSTGRSPTKAEFAIEITCLVGGLILCFIAVVLNRLAALSRRLDTLDPPAEPGD